MLGRDSPAALLSKAPPRASVVQVEGVVGRFVFVCMCVYFECVCPFFLLFQALLTLFCFLFTFSLHHDSSNDGFDKIHSGQREIPEKPRQRACPDRSGSCGVLC